MKSVEYRILAYADSEEVIAGVDFLIILRLGSVPGRCLRAFLIEDWRALLGIQDAMTIEYLEDFVFDVRQNLVRSGSEVHEFFRAIEELSVGPLRTTAAGLCNIEDVDAVTSSLPIQSAEILDCSSDMFRLLMKSIVTTDRQLQAART